MVSEHDFSIQSSIFFFYFFLDFAIMSITWFSYSIKISTEIGISLQEKFDIEIHLPKFSVIVGEKYGISNTSFIDEEYNLGIDCIDFQTVRMIIEQTIQCSIN